MTTKAKVLSIAAHAAAKNKVAEKKASEKKATEVKIFRSVNAWLNGNNKIVMDIDGQDVPLDGLSETEVKLIDILMLDPITRPGEFVAIILGGRNK